MFEFVKRKLAPAAVAGAIALGAGSAQAFCGFYVAGGDAKLFNAVSGLAGEGFVQFINVDVLTFQSSQFQGSWDGECWSNSHDFWGDSLDREGEHSSQNFQS